MHALTWRAARRHCASGHRARRGWHVLTRARAPDALCAYNAQAKNAASIHKAIKEGAVAFLRTEYRAIASFMVPFAIFIFVLLGSGDAFTCASGAPACVLYNAHACLG